MKILLNIVLIISLIFPLNSNLIAQDYWAEWDKNYKQISYSDLLAFETYYADSISQNKEIPQTYCRVDKYQITGKFKGETRPIDNETFLIMKRVLKIFSGNSNQLDGLVKSECLFEIEGQEVWLPIQHQLEQPLFEELEVDSFAVLYCLFFNEHSLNGQLKNIFLISEFYPFEH